MSDGAVQEKRRTDLLEELAALEHEQWKSWALSIIDCGHVDPVRAKRWLEIIQMGGYRNLTEELKDKDREWAERILWIVKKHMGIK